MRSKSLNRIPLYIDDTLLGYYYIYDIESNGLSNLASSTLGDSNPSRSTKANKILNAIRGTGDEFILRHPVQINTF